MPSPNYDPELLLQLHEANESGPEDELIVNILNGLYKEGRIRGDALPLMRFTFEERAAQWARMPVEAFGSSELLDAIERTRGILRATVFHKVNGTEYLFDASNGTLLVSGKPQSLGPGTAVEILAELFLIVLSLWHDFGAKAKEIANEVVKDVAENPTVRKLLAELIEVLRGVGAATKDAASEKIRALLAELFELVRDSFKEFLSKVLDSLDWIDIGLTLLDMLLMFTPIGWAKKYAKLILELGLFGYHCYHKLA